MCNVRINHSNNAIVKPPELTPQAAAKELEDVMKRVREAQSSIAAAIDPGPSYSQFSHIESECFIVACPLSSSSVLRTKRVSRRTQPTSKSAHPADPGNQEGRIPDLALIHVLTHNGNAPDPGTGEFNAFRFNPLLINIHVYRAQISQTSTTRCLIPCL